MKLKNNLFMFFLLWIFSIATYAADTSEEIVISAYKRQLIKYEIEKLAHCRYKMSTVGGMGAIKLITVKSYSFVNFERAAVIRTISLPYANATTRMIAEDFPFAVSIIGRQLITTDVWFEPNPHNVPPKVGLQSNYDDLYFKNEEDANKFQLAITSFAKTCN